jgi:hypothetical protein
MRAPVAARKRDPSTVACERLRLERGVHVVWQVNRRASLAAEVSQLSSDREGLEARVLALEDGLAAATEAAEQAEALAAEATARLQQAVTAAAGAAAAGAAAGSTAGAGPAAAAASTVAANGSLGGAAADAAAGPVDASAARALGARSLSGGGGGGGSSAGRSAGGSAAAALEAPGAAALAAQLLAAQREAGELRRELERTIVGNADDSEALEKDNEELREQVRWARRPRAVSLLPPESEQERGSGPQLWLRGGGRARYG